MNQDLDALMERMQSNEPLDEALVPWMEETDSMGPVLKHPLVFQVPFMSAGQANYVFEHKQKMLADYKKSKNWSGCVYVHERPYRLDALLGIADEIEKDEEYWDLVGDVWVDSENIWQNYEEWQELFSDTRPGRENMMNDEERAALAALPDEIVIYRGCHQELNEDGLSWTTSRETAIWFAKRFADYREVMPVVIVGKINKENVLAYFAGRGESEIIAFDHAVTVIKYEEVARDDK